MLYARILLIFLSVFYVVFSTSAYALPAERGALRGVIPNQTLGSDFPKTIGNMTDGNDSSSSYFYNGDYARWDLSRSRQIIGYYLRADGDVTVNFYDYTTGAVTTLSATTGSSWKTINITNMNHVILSSRYGGTVYEFDVLYADTTPPGEVRTLVGKPLSTKSVQLTWVDPTDSDLKEIRLYRDEVLVSTVQKGIRSFTDSNLEPGTTYTYKLVTVDNSGNASAGLKTVVKTLDPDVTPPGEITNIVTTVYNDRIKITWTNPPDTDFLQVLILKNGIPVAAVNTPANQFTDYDLDEHTTYTFLFKTVDNDGNISTGVSISEKTKGKPSKVTGLIGTPGMEKVALGFDRSDDPELHGYNIYQDGVKVATSVDEFFMIPGLEAGKKYVFTVTAFNQWGESLPSDPFEVVPLTASAPTDLSLKATAVTHSHISLQFSAEKADSLTLYKDQSELASFSGTSGAYFDQDLKPSSLYVYRLVAQNEIGTTEKELSVKTLAIDQMPSIPISDLSLVPVAQSAGSAFSSLWWIIAFVVGISLAFIYGKNIKDMFT